MRYAKALLRDFRFLPGLHGACRTGAPQPMQKQHGTRDEGNTTHTLHDINKRVVSFSRWLCRSRRSSTANSQTTTLLVLDEAKIVVAQHRSCSHSRHNHNDHVPTVRGDAWGVPGCPVTASSTGLVACLADRRGLGTTAVFGRSQRLFPLTMCGTPNPDASFDRGRGATPIPGELFCWGFFRNVI